MRIENVRIFSSTAANSYFHPHKKPRNFFRGNEYVQININLSDHSARSSLIQTLLSVLEFHQISRQSGSRTIPPVGNFDFQGFRSPCPEEIFFIHVDYTIEKR